MNRDHVFGAALVSLAPRAALACGRLEPLTEPLIVLPTIIYVGVIIVGIFRLTTGTRPRKWHRLLSYYGFPIYSLFLALSLFDEMGPGMLHFDEIRLGDAVFDLNPNDIWLLFVLPCVTFAVTLSAELSVRIKFRASGGGSTDV